MREIRWLALGLVLGGLLILGVSARPTAPPVQAQAGASGQLWKHQCFEEWGDGGAKLAP